MLTAVGFCSHPKIHLAFAEEQSILNGATVDTSNILIWQSTSANALIHGGFMSLATSKFDDPCGCRDKEFTIYLQQEYSIVSVFAHSTNTGHNRNTQIWIINYNLLMNQSTEAIFDSGLFFIKPPNRALAKMQS